MDNQPFSARLYQLKQRLAQIVVEHEPEHLAPYVDQEIAAFLADAPPAQTKRLKFAIDAMLQRMTFSGSGIEAPTRNGRRNAERTASVRVRIPNRVDRDIAPDEPERQIRQRALDLSSRQARRVLASSTR